MSNECNYHEVHLIVRGAFNDSHRDFARAFGFWASKIEADEGDDRAQDVILTTRVPRADLAREAITELTNALKRGGIDVRRYKVEHCTLDSNIADELELL